MGISIRKATMNEAQAIIDLHTDTVRRVNSRDYSPEQIEGWIGKRKIEITEGMIANGEYYVAVDEEDHLLGTGYMKDGSITGLYVSADHQGHGIGSSLLIQMESDAILLGCLESIIESTLTAAPFYMRMGYEEIGRIRIGPAQLDVVEMRKVLAASNMERDR